MNGLCEGRVAIVTGAAQGIGREYALFLAAQGARVVVNDLGTGRDGAGANTSAADAVVAEIRAAGGSAVANGDDVSDWAGAGRMVQQAIETFGRLDVLINNAGILRDRMITNMTEGEWDAVVKVHLKGSFAPMHHASVHWRSRSKESGQPVAGRVINTSSSSGLWGKVGQANYGAAKAGIAALTIIGARELGRYGVTVNAIMPHAETRMTESIKERTAEEKEIRHPRWIAPVVGWLASERSAAVTGRVFELGGGHLVCLEGWHRGPGAEPTQDLDEIDRIMNDLSSRARRNADSTGKEVD
jgi:NAD(P)-dependent dehydrogenase (short-subunit alcohol dehydrogenase family)